MKEIHDECQEGLRLMILSGQELIPALHDLDASGIENAELMNETPVHIPRSTDLIQEVMAERGYGPSWDASPFPLIV